MRRHPLVMPLLLAAGHEFQLGTLARGEVEEVPPRVLRDQLPSLASPVPARPHQRG